MSYCTADEVKLIVNTELDTSSISQLITLADTEVDLMLGVGWSGDTNTQKLISMLLTAALISDRDPESYAIGAARIQYGNRVSRWKDRAAEIASRAKSTAAKPPRGASRYRKIDEAKRYPV